MVIRIMDFVPGANTAEQGDLVFGVLKEALQKGGEVVLSFDDVKTATSSFVNAAFVELLKYFSYSDLKARLRVIRSTRQINEMIKMRLEHSAGIPA
jgi:STAS-like domain of unknown function (DUF4325)